MKAPYIGVTGITTYEDVANMIRALRGHYGMYGVLTHPGILNGEQGRGKWPDGKDIWRLFGYMPVNAVRALHLCKSALTFKDICDALAVAGGYCNAIQLNTSKYPDLEVIKRVKKEYGHTIIFQFSSRMFEDPVEMVRKFKPYAPYCEYAIIDQSGGQGKSLDPEVSKGVAWELVKLETGVVFAGGLNAERVREITPMIQEVNASIDAEGNLMEYGVLSSARVAEYIKAGLAARGL